MAKAVPEICDILVSTDDALIAEIAQKAEAMVPWLRPAELATDLASSADVGIHALHWYEQEKGSVDGLMLLQPTSPFRSRQTLRRGIELFRRHQFRPVVSVSSVDVHPMHCFQISGATMRPLIDGQYNCVRSQDLPPLYVVNGAFYLITPGDLRRQGSFYSESMVPLVIPDRREGIDIDTEWDWNVAEAILSLKEPVSLG